MQSRTTLRLLAFLLLAFAFLCNSSAAQTGGILPKAAELNQGGAYAGAPVGDTIDGVDLRKYFPPVGDQSMNDCTAWAVSAAKSCLEAMDQRWDPNRPQTMFSPAFIYPQINNGIDEGSSLVAAALLLEDRGAGQSALCCATSGVDIAVATKTVKEKFLMVSVVLNYGIPCTLCAGKKNKKLKPWRRRFGRVDPTVPRTHFNASPIRAWTILTTPS